MMNEFTPQDTLIDRAINDFPLEALPPGFTGRMMSQISTNPQIAPQFRLQFIDYALPVFGTLFALILTGLVAWLSGAVQIEGIPPAEITTPIMTYLSALSPSWIVFGILILGAELAMGLAISSQLLFDQPAVSANRS